MSILFDQVLRKRRKSIGSLVGLDNYCALDCLNGTSYGFLVFTPRFVSSRFSSWKVRKREKKVAVGNDATTSHYDYWPSSRVRFFLSGYLLHDRIITAELPIFSAFFSFACCRAGVIVVTKNFGSGRKK